MARFWNEKIIGITNKMEKKKTIPCPSCPVITSFFEFATFHKVFQFLVY